MKNKICLIGLTLTLATGLSGAVSQCQSQLPSGSAAKLVEYYHPAHLDAFQCDPGKGCSLSGWLYIPMHDHGAVELPTVIYNHGSGPDKPEPCAVARYFLQKG